MISPEETERRTLESRAAHAWNQLLQSWDEQNEAFRSLHRLSDIHAGCPLTKNQKSLCEALLAVIAPDGWFYLPQRLVDLSQPYVIACPPQVGVNYDYHHYHVTKFVWRAPMPYPNLGTHEIRLHTEYLFARRRTGSHSPVHWPVSLCPNPLGIIPPVLRIEHAALFPPSHSFVERLESQSLTSPDPEPS